MAGSSPDFDPDQFRADIRAAMLMGTPADVALRPTFRFADTSVYDNADRTGKPWDWSDAPAPTSPVRPVERQVLCAVETDAGPVVFTGLGQFDADRATLTLLDEEFEQVKGFVDVKLGGNVYLYSKTLPPNGLHEVTVYTVLVTAEDES